MSEEAIQALGRAVDKASRIVCFTGAGISTESGIPDFPAECRPMDQNQTHTVSGLHRFGGCAQGILATQILR